MIKDKLHTISDDDARKVAEILLKTSTSSLFNFSFDKISRQVYDDQHGVDAEESINVFFKGEVKDNSYRQAGWKDKRIMIQLIESDRYHDYPYFIGFYMEETDKTWKYHFLSNHIEAIEYLQAINIL